MAIRKNADGSITIGIIKEQKPVNETPVVDAEPKLKKAKAKNSGEG